MLRSLTSWVLWAGGLLLGLLILVWSTEPLLEAASGAPSPDEAVALAAAVLAWLVCGWLLLGTAAALAEAAVATCGGRLGRATLPSRLARAVTPTALRVVIRRSVGTSLAMSALTGVGMTGVGLVATPAWAVATATVSSAGPAYTDDSRSPNIPSLDRPATDGRTSEHPTTEPAPRGSAHYLVRPGDTLWDIAAAHLPGRPTSVSIARVWPLWWQANRSVVGDDPGLIRPGQVLQAPGGAR